MRYFSTTIPSTSDHEVDGFAAFPGEISSAIVNLFNDGDGVNPSPTWSSSQYSWVMAIVYDGVFVDNGYLDDLVQWKEITSKEATNFRRYASSREEATRPEVLIGEPPFTPAEMRVLTAFRVFLQRCESHQDSKRIRNAGTFVMTNLNSGKSLAFKCVEREEDEVEVIKRPWPISVFNDIAQFSDRLKPETLTALFPPEFLIDLGFQIGADGEIVIQDKS